jgi:hypothetical protein
MFSGCAFQVDDANVEQNIVKGFTDSGFKTQVQPLSHFQTDYGLAADEDEAEEDTDEEGEDAETSSFVSGDEDDE